MEFAVWNPFKVRLNWITHKPTRSRHRVCSSWQGYTIGRPDAFQRGETQWHCCPRGHWHSYIHNTLSNGRQVMTEASGHWSKAYCTPDCAINQVLQHFVWATEREESDEPNAHFFSVSIAMPFTHSHWANRKAYLAGNPLSLILLAHSFILQLLLPV